jgi:uncharacterized protein (TIGR03067 family)
MRLTALLLFVTAGFLVAAQPASPEDPALQGTWSLVSVEVNGQPLPMDNFKQARLTIEGNRYFFQLDQIRLELGVKVDVGKAPRTIDLEVMTGDQKGQVYHGIYRIENGRYTICRTTDPGKERPTEFTTRPNSGQMMVVWKRMDLLPK